MDAALTLDLTVIETGQPESENTDWSVNCRYGLFEEAVCLGN